MARLGLRLPLWAALAIIGAAYLLRAFTRRGGSLAPELPGDIVVAIVLVIGIAAVAWARHRVDGAPTEDHEDPPDPKT